MNLLNLAPDIQEEILFLPPVAGEREAVSERQVRALAKVVVWRMQRKAWGALHLAGPCRTLDRMSDTGRSVHRRTPPFRLA